MCFWVLLDTSSLTVPSCTRSWAPSCCATAPCWCGDSMDCAAALAANEAPRNADDEAAYCASILQEMREGM